MLERNNRVTQARLVFRLVMRKAMFITFPVIRINQQVLQVWNGTYQPNLNTPPKSRQLQTGQNSSVPWYFASEFR
jgi:hypothetical protein